MEKRAAGVPEALARLDNRVVRPRDLADRYTNPVPEFGRMVGTGVLAKVAHGYYAVVPEDQRGRRWTPPIEEIALGVAAVDYGAQEVAVMGMAAARLLGAVPRALATAAVAVPRQRANLLTPFGLVRFVKRTVGRLEVQRVRTTIVDGFVTTVEQTVLDLAHRPDLDQLTLEAVDDALLALAPKCDPGRLETLALAQRRRAALGRYRHLLRARETRRRPLRA